MHDVPALFRRASDHFGSLVHLVRDDQWSSATPCTEWDVRALVNHGAVEDLWVPPLMEGKTIAEVGDAFDGDQLGDESTAAWDRAVAAAQASFSSPGAMERSVHLSSGVSTADEYASPGSNQHASAAARWRRPLCFRQCATTLERSSHAQSAPPQRPGRRPHPETPLTACS